MLAIEGSGEGFTALRVEPGPVPEANLRVPADARKVSPEDLDDLREQAEANFRQQMLSAPIPNK